MRSCLEGIWDPIVYLEFVLLQKQQRCTVFSTRRLLRQPLFSTEYKDTLLLSGEGEKMVR